VSSNNKIGRKTSADFGFWGKVTLFKLTFMYQTISLNPILDKTYIKHAADSIPLPAGFY